MSPHQRNSSRISRLNMTLDSDNQWQVWQLSLSAPSGIAIYDYNRFCQYDQIYIEDFHLPTELPASVTVKADT